MIGEDELERLLRMIAERRQAMVEQIVQGGVSSDNVLGGFRDCTGYVRGLDDADKLVREVFRGWLPDPPKPKEARKIQDY